MTCGDEERQAKRMPFWSPNRGDEVLSTLVLSEKDHGRWAGKGVTRGDSLIVVSLGKGVHLVASGRNNTQGEFLRSFMFFFYIQKEGNMGLVKYIYCDPEALSK